MDISIIIPCFNHGLYIQEAIDSVVRCKEIDLEIIIVNDGSTDNLTINKLNQLKAEGFLIIDQLNSGPSKARNAAIQVSKGKYILPLDADNKIKPEYITKAISLLEDENIDIIYSNAIFIGENIVGRRFVPQPFDADDLFFRNYIDTCSVFRRKVWEKLGGFDENIAMHEDWEFWLHASINGFKFHYIDDQLFYYRIARNSLMDTSDPSADWNKTYEYIIKKHLIHFIQVSRLNYRFGKMYQSDMVTPLRSSFKYLSYFLDFKKKLR